MRSSVYVTISIVSLLLLGVCRPSQKAEARKTVITRQPETCSANPDSLYERKIVLEHLAQVLNAATPGFRKYEDTGFYFEHDRPQHFFVYDLSDPSNKSTPSTGCINFLDKHVYHFAARYIPFSLSHVAFLEAGKMKIFKAINCENSKESLTDVLRYVEVRSNLENKDEIIKRLKEYRTYGEYFTVDDPVIRCGQLGLSAP